MRRFGSTRDLEAARGELLGVSDWAELGERDLQEFGRLTRDEHWIHVDPDRAAAEGPFGSVIAHGFFTLSLVTGLGNECYAIDAAQRWVNYGLDRVRFLRPLTPGMPFRLELTLEDVEITPSGGRLRLGCSLVTRTGDPVLAATWLVLVIETEEFP
ncbi:MaoC/PaaZ C-terminal domain-containing protein [Qaidamihabitans albus]|uniref:MaoC/PaaZ C-terminal domain-containing protein n=1 Tax=Qaidamihabitans albus TaxID=2795733 RepID=UPI0018F217FD|nr:MaoC/PaaZ C-terminal domain-containing protein [Qaidamihabitans albus]